MDWKRIPRLVACPTFLATLLSSPVLLADPITPWEGARADAYASGVQSSQQGSVAEASANGKTRVYYTSPNANYEPDAYSVEARSFAKAEVLGTRDALFRLNINHEVDNPGTRPTNGHTIPYGADGAIAEASWNGDRIHITQNQNGAMPDHVRLGVMLELNSPWQWADPVPSSGSVIDLKFGDRAIKFGGLRTDPFGLDISSRLVEAGFDSAERIQQPDLGRYQAKAFLDLAIDDQGWSNPFDLNLKVGAGTFLESNRGLYIGVNDLTLSLDDLILSDGTSLVDAGYDVSFASGLEWPQPVPEPASIACWFALVGSAGWQLSRKRFRTAAAQESLDV